MEACASRDLMAGVVAVIQTFGNRLNFHPHLHMLLTEGGRSSDGGFHPDFHRNFNMESREDAVMIGAHGEYYDPGCRIH